MQAGAARRPFETLSTVPSNWVRQSFCTDLCHPPEVVQKMLTKDINLTIERHNVGIGMFRASGDAAPAMVNGVSQQPLHGTSIVFSFDDGPNAVRVNGRYGASNHTYRAFR